MKNSGKFATFQWADRVVGPYNDPRSPPVGADASCPPAGCTDFTGIFGEFVTSQRADVGIGPYRVLRKFADAHRAEQICQAPTGVYRKREIGIYSGGYYVHLIRS